MNKILRADFSRLKKAKIFWVCIAAMAVYAIVLALCLYNAMKREGGAATFDQYFFSAFGMAGYMPIPGLLMAALCSVFVGTDFSDGTIRNKLISGCSRSGIYLSHFITCAAAGICLLAAYWLPAFALGIPLFGTFQASGPALLQMILGGILATVSYAAVFTMLGILVQNKTATAIISLIGVVAGMFIVLFLISRIREPEFIDQIIYDVNQLDQIANGEISGLTVPNPNYLTPVQRMIAQFIIDLLPTGQSLQIGGMIAPNLWRISFCALGVTAAATVGGILAFRKKDLK